VRGVRINTRNKGGLPFEAVTSFAAALADLDWTIQFQVKPEQIPDIIALSGSVPTAIVIDHLGFIPLGTAKTEAHVDDLRRLLDMPRCFVKLSAPYRLGHDSRTAFAEVARRLVASHADRLLWGSDWPHTELWDNMPDDADLIDAIADWAPTETIRQTILADNSQSLFFSR
jgi:predicted TIM-barrel fold metal-dependent hydrolase